MATLLQWVGGVWAAIGAIEIWILIRAGPFRIERIGGVDFQIRDTESQSLAIVVNMLVYVLPGLLVAGLGGLINSSRRQGGEVPTPPQADTRTTKPPLSPPPMAPVPVDAHKKAPVSLPPLPDEPGQSVGTEGPAGTGSPSEPSEMSEIAFGVLVMVLAGLAVFWVVTWVASHW